jgi:hypothetical protein
MKDTVYTNKAIDVICEMSRVSGIPGIPEYSLSFIPDGRILEISLGAMCPAVLDTIFARAILPLVPLESQEVLMASLHALPDYQREVRSTEAYREESAVFPSLPKTTLVIWDTFYSIGSPMPSTL